MSPSTVVLQFHTSPPSTATFQHNDVRTGTSDLRQSVEDTPEKETPDQIYQSTERLLVVSPYTARPHLLDLNAVDIACQLLAQALTILEPSRSDYAVAPYDQAFNWGRVVKKLYGLNQSRSSPFRWTRRSFYIVVFRSQIPTTTDRSHLGALDRAAHSEAMQGGALLKYWFGTPDEAGRNLATCIWRDREDACRGGSGPEHAKAMSQTRVLYSEWKVERLSLSIDADAKNWSVVDAAH